MALNRRQVFQGLAVAGLVASSQAATACSYAEFDEDDWGNRLIAFLRSGDTDKLDGLFSDESTLVAFNGGLIEGSNRLSFEGAAKVKGAMAGFYREMTSKGFAGNTPRKLQSAKLVGSKQQGRMNKIELLFAEEKVHETGCDPSRSELAVDLFYEADVYETGYDWVKWSIGRIALLPKLELERFPDFD